MYAPLDGSCAQGRSVGDIKEYSQRLQAKKTSLGFIRIRSYAVFSVEDQTNILGTVPAGTLLWGVGPLKNADFSAGIGYAVLIRDKLGKTCRGYVSITVVDELWERTPNKSVN